MFHLTALGVGRQLKTRNDLPPQVGKGNGNSNSDDSNSDSDSDSKEESSDEEESAQESDEPVKVSLMPFHAHSIDCLPNIF
jgi:hypothetical protein